LEIISFEELRTQYAEDQRKLDKTIVKRLKPHIGKKIVVVFKDAVVARKNIRRHRCTLDSLGHICLLFSPCIRIPRKKYTDLLMKSAGFNSIKQIEIK
jgi:hypothetical protein